MELHKNSDEFRAAISGASNQFQLAQHIVEKDYWITMLLNKIAVFEYNDNVIFKGGTLLSKGFDLIKRFSEDIDVGIKSDAISSGTIHKRSGEAIHRVIKKLKTLNLKVLQRKKNLKNKDTNEHTNIQSCFHTRKVLPFMVKLS